MNFFFDGQFFDIKIARNMPFHALSGKFRSLIHRFYEGTDQIDGPKMALF
jgi:hypothetical protein